MEKSVKRQRVVRTYPKGYTNATLHLEKALDDGWSVFIANTFYCGNEKGIEYILEKEIDPADSNLI